MWNSDLYFRQTSPEVAVKTHMHCITFMCRHLFGDKHSRRCISVVYLFQCDVDQSRHTSECHCTIYMDVFMCVVCFRSLPLGTTKHLDHIKESICLVKKKNNK